MRSLERGTGTRIVSSTARSSAVILMRSSGGRAFDPFSTVSEGRTTGGGGGSNFTSWTSSGAMSSSLSESHKSTISINDFPDPDTLSFSFFTSFSFVLPDGVSYIPSR